MDRRKHTALWVLCTALLSMLMFGAACSPSFDHHTNIELNREQSSFDLNHSSRPLIGSKNALNQPTLLPTPNVHFLFHIVTLPLLLGVVRFLMHLYPAIFLLRKKEMLLPIKFTSVFVGRASLL